MGGQPHHATISHQHVQFLGKDGKGHNTSTVYSQDTLYVALLQMGCTGSDSLHTII